MVWNACQGHLVGKMAVKTKVAMGSHAGSLKHNAVHVCLYIK